MSEEVDKTLFVQGRPVDHPFDEVAENGVKLINEGATIYFKFTCEECGARQQFEEPNVLYRKGRCEECSHVTSLEENGCGFMAVWGGTL